MATHRSNLKNSKNLWEAATNDFTRRGVNCENLGMKGREKGRKRSW